MRAMVSAARRATSPQLCGSLFLRCSSDHSGGGCVRSISEASASMCCTALRASAAMRSISSARPAAPGCSCRRWPDAEVYWTLPRSAFHSSVTESSPLSGASGTAASAKAVSSGKSSPRRKVMVRIPSPCRREQKPGTPPGSR